MSVCVGWSRVICFQTQLHTLDPPTPTPASKSIKNVNVPLRSTKEPLRQNSGLKGLNPHGYFSTYTKACSLSTKHVCICHFQCDNQWLCILDVFFCNLCPRPADVFSYYIYTLTKLPFILTVKVLRERGGWVEAPFNRSVIFLVHVD